MESNTMGTFLTFGWSEERNPTPTCLRDALDRIEEYQGEEQIGVSLTCGETEWSVGTFVDGCTVWMNLGCEHFGFGYPRHMLDIPRVKVIALWLLLAARRFDEIESEPWLPGHGSDAACGPT